MKWIAGTLLLFMMAVIVSVTAAPYAYGNISNYTAPGGGSDTITINTNVPLTMEDTAYPAELFYFLMVFGFCMIGLAIVFVADNTNVPSISITACGLISMGCFLISAYIAPLVASTTVSQQATAGSIYVTSVNNYLFSPWVGYFAWGCFIAAFIVFLTGALSFFGYFHKTGSGKAWRGDYVEQDGQGEGQQYRSVGRKYQ